MNLTDKALVFLLSTICAAVTVMGALGVDPFAPSAQHQAQPTVLKEQ